MESSSWQWGPARSSSGLLSTLMAADLSIMISGRPPVEEDVKSEGSHISVTLMEEEQRFSEEDDEPPRIEARVVVPRLRLWAMESEKSALRAVQSARNGLATIESRAARAVAHVRRIIDEEVDRFRSLRLRRPDVDAKKRSLHFLAPTSETAFEAATRVVRWLRQEASLLALGPNDETTSVSSSSASDEEPTPDKRRGRSCPPRLDSGELANQSPIREFLRKPSSRDSMSRKTLGPEGPPRVLQRVCVYVGSLVEVARGARVCRAWRDRTDRRRAGRLVWKWIARFGIVPSTGTESCAGLWLMLAKDIHSHTLAGMVSFDGDGRTFLDEPDSPWSKAIAVDAARTPLTRLWRGVRVPGARYYVTFDEADAETLKPYRETIAKICGLIATQRPRLGYCQGLDYVVAYALRAAKLDPERARVLVNTLLDDLGFAGLFEPGLPGLKKRCLELSLLLDARCPDLASRLAGHSVHVELFAAAWIQTLFVYVDALPMAVLDRVWTLLLLERSWKIMHRLALAIFAALEPHVLASCHAPHETLIFLSQLTSGERADQRRRKAVDGEHRVIPSDLLDDDDHGKKLLASAMNIKVTNSMLARIGNNEALPKPLRAANSKSPGIVTVDQ